MLKFDAHLVERHPYAARAMLLIGVDATVPGGTTGSAPAARTTSRARGHNWRIVGSLGATTVAAGRVRGCDA